MDEFRDKPARTPDQHNSENTRHKKTDAMNPHPTIPGARGYRDGEQAGFRLQRVHLRPCSSARAFLESVKTVGDEGKSIGYTLAKKDAFDELRKFILEQEADIENRESCGIMINLGASYYKLRQSLEKEVKMLISIVENGSPLRGKCQLCPKVKISPAS